MAGGVKRFLLVLLLLTVAGGNPPSKTAKSSPSAATSQQPSPSPLPAFPSPTPGGPAAPPPVAVVCTSRIPSGHQLALVTLRGVQGGVVRDVTDIQHPVTRCGFSGGAYFRFIGATRGSDIVTSSGDL